MTTEAKIHCFSGSPFTWRALIALEEKSVPYEARWIPRMSGEHLTPDMLALNPRGKLPVLELDDGIVLYESLAICRFLELAYPQPALYPAERAARARAIVRTAEVEAYLLPAAMTTLELGLMRKAGEAVSDEQRAANRAMLDELARWESYLDEGRAYLANDEFSMADLAAFPPIAFAVRCKLDMSRFPHLAAWYARIAERPSVQSSWPPHWKDSDGSDIGLNEL